MIAKIFKISKNKHDELTLGGCDNLFYSIYEDCVMAELTTQYTVKKHTINVPWKAPQRGWIAISTDEAAKQGSTRGNCWL
jgi:hypothetical protein